MTKTYKRYYGIGAEGNFFFRLPFNFYFERSNGPAVSAALAGST